MGEVKEGMDQYDPYPETEFEVYTSVSYGNHKAAQGTHLPTQTVCKCLTDNNRNYSLI